MEMSEMYKIIVIIIITIISPWLVLVGIQLWCRADAGCRVDAAADKVCHFGLSWAAVLEDR